MMKPNLKEETISPPVFPLNLPDTNQNFLVDVVAVGGERRMFQ